MYRCFLLKATSEWFERVTVEGLQWTMQIWSDKSDLQRNIKSQAQPEKNKQNLLI